MLYPTLTRPIPPGYIRLEPDKPARRDVDLCVNLYRQQVGWEKVGALAGTLPSNRTDWVFITPVKEEKEWLNPWD